MICHTGIFSHLEALLSLLLGILSDDQLASIKLGQAAHLSAIHTHIIKLLVQLELGLHGLDGGGGLDGPGASILADGHGGGGGGGCLPQQPTEVQHLATLSLVPKLPFDKVTNLQEIIILLSRSPGESSLECLHCGDKLDTRCQSLDQLTYDFLSM